MTKTLKQQRLNMEFALARSSTIHELLKAAQDKPTLVLTETVTTTRTYSSPLSTAIVGVLLVEEGRKDAVVAALEMCRSVLATVLASKAEAQTVQQQPETNGKSISR